MGLSSFFILRMLKGEVEMELLSKLNWQLFKGDCDPNFIVMVAIHFFLD